MGVRPSLRSITQVFQFPQGCHTCFLILSSSQSLEVENLPTTHTGKLRPRSPNDGGQRMILRLVHQGAPRSSTKLQNGEGV